MSKFVVLARSKSTTVEAENVSLAVCEGTSRLDINGMIVGIVPLGEQSPNVHWFECEVSFAEYVRVAVIAL